MGIHQYIVAKDNSVKSLFSFIYRRFKIYVNQLIAEVINHINELDIP
jgi:hypothetical protein